MENGVFIGIGVTVVAGLLTLPKTANVHYAIAETILQIKAWRGNKMIVKKVKRLKDSCGAYCEVCDTFFQGSWPWHYSKSKWMHEKGTGHKVILVGWKREDITLKEKEILK